MWHTHTDFFFFHIPPTTPIYTLSLHDALPISVEGVPRRPVVDEVHLQRLAHLQVDRRRRNGAVEGPGVQDRKSTRLNSSHTVISYAVFCLKKKIIFEQQMQSAVSADRSVWSRR